MHAQIISQISQRSYLEAHIELSPVTYDMAYQSNTVPQQDFENLDEYVNVTLIITNNGKTPALDVDGYYRIGGTGYAMQPHEIESEIVKLSNIKSLTNKAEINIGPFKMHDVILYFFYGKIHYTDVFGSRNIDRFCFKFNKNVVSVCAYPNDYDTIPE